MSQHDSRSAKPVVLPSQTPSATFIHKVSIAPLVQSIHLLTKEPLLGCVCQGEISDGGLACQRSRGSQLMADVDVNQDNEIHTKAQASAPQLTSSEVVDLS